MKTLTLKLGEKVYTSGKVTAWHSREAFALNKDMIKIAKSGKEIQESKLQEESVLIEFLEEMESVNNRKSNLICEVFGNKFTLDELEKHLDQEEISDTIKSIVNGISGVVAKN